VRIVPGPKEKKNFFRGGAGGGVARSLKTRNTRITLGVGKGERVGGRLFGNRARISLKRGRGPSIDSVFVSGYLLRGGDILLQGEEEKAIGGGGGKCYIANTPTKNATQK